MMRKALIAAGENVFQVSDRLGFEYLQHFIGSGFFVFTKMNVRMFPN